MFCHPLTVRALLFGDHQLHVATPTEGQLTPSYANKSWPIRNNSKAMDVALASGADLMKVRPATHPSSVYAELDGLALPPGGPFLEQIDSKPEAWVASHGFVVMGSLSIDVQNHGSQ